MACVIAAPSSGSGKTILSLLLIAWARKKRLKLQPFKVGPDYLDSQLLSSLSGLSCRNLDLVLCGSDWVSDSFSFFGGLADFALIEGVMGLFDGVGSSSRGSTADIARHFDLPVILVVDASGQASSIAALVRGFIEHDPKISFAGVVLNRVNTSRHKDLLTEVLDGLGVKVLGCLPDNSSLILPSTHLGLLPAHEQNIVPLIDQWSLLAEENLDLISLTSILEPPRSFKDPFAEFKKNEPLFLKNKLPIAVAEDEVFHFNYPETKNCLELLGMPVIKWRPIDNEPLPKEAKGIIIPGGFPEQYAEQLSHCSRSIEDIRKNIGIKPIYAECGGMLLLGQSLLDFEGRKHKMSGILPFDSRKGSLKVGYREIKSTSDSLIVHKGEKLLGHEFHSWELIEKKNIEGIKKLDKMSQENGSYITQPWEISGWKIPIKKEGWCTKKLHASWIHLHWASCIRIVKYWRSSLEDRSDI